MVEWSDDCADRDGGMVQDFFFFFCLPTNNRRWTERQSPPKINHQIEERDRSRDFFGTSASPDHDVAAEQKLDPIHLQSRNIYWFDQIGCNPFLSRSTPLRLLQSKPGRRTHSIKGSSGGSAKLKYESSTPMAPLISDSVAATGILVTGLIRFH